MRKLLLGVALVLAGCRNDEFTLERVEPGAECANGGVRLIVPGKAPQVVCDGARGTNGTNGVDGMNGADGTNGDAGLDGLQSLVRQVTIQPGDPRCPTGGVEVQSGLDLSSDGTLDASEVTTRTVVCNGNTGALLGSTTAPAGDAGTATIRVNGGVGGIVGGTAGQINLVVQAGSNGGHLKVWTTGKVDATQAAPTVSALDPGAVPLDVTTNLTLAPTSNPGALDAGTLYAGTDGLYFAGATPRQVTSLHVAPGVTLTLPTGTYNFQSSCRIDGTLAFTVTQASTQFGCADLAMSAASRVRPALGRSMRLWTFLGDFVAAGTIDGSADATDPAVALDFFSAQTLHVSGTVRANGHPASPNAGSIRFGAGNDLVLSGTIEAIGADVAWAGNSAGGGAGGAITIDQYYPWAFGRLGEFRSSASIRARGGAVTGALVTCGQACVGGPGGSLSVTAMTAFLDGLVDVRGGAGFIGGGGGTVSVGIAPSAPPTNAMSSLWSSASIDASGGDGSNAGPGGRVDLHLDNPSPGGELVLLGMSGLEANGSFGSQGGNAGTITMVQNSRTGEVTGAVINTASLSANGGESSSASGGRGGEVQLYTNVFTTHANVTWETASNSGRVSVLGGRGSAGGPGGYFRLMGLFGVTSSGAVDASGGAGTTGPGASGGLLSFSSARGEVTISAPLTTSAGVAGGGPVQSPGSGGAVEVLAERVRLSSPVVARGGSADPTTGTGGPGGYVRLSSQVAPSVLTVAKPAGIDVRGGAAATAGTSGRVVIDGFLDTLSWTH